MGVLQEKGQWNTLLLFTERVATLGTTAKRSDTPPILMVVLCVIGTSLHWEIDRHIRHEEVALCTDMTETGKWSSL